MRGILNFQTLKLTIFFQIKLMTINLKKHILLFCLLIIANLTAIAKDTLATKPLLNNTSQTTILEIKDADKIFKQKEVDWWDKYSSAIIALITVFGSAFLSYKIANKQTNLAKEQLELTKKQMEENYRVAIAQVKANNISGARIDWIQNLRPLLADLISKTSQLEVVFTKLDKILDIEDPEEQTEEEIEEEDALFDQLEKMANENEKIWNQILLFLNKDEKEHSELIKSYQEFVINLELRSNKKPIIKQITEDELIDKSRAVLKTAWEQAKNIN